MTQSDFHHIGQRATWDLGRLCGQGARELETAFLTERYHRAFDDELAMVVRLTEPALLASAANGRTTEVRASLAGLRHRLSFHSQLQEARLFPCYERAQPIPDDLMECWSEDAIGLFKAAEDLRNIATDLDGPMGFLRRLRHLIDEIEEHLAAEVRLFAGGTPA